MRIEIARRAQTYKGTFGYMRVFDGDELIFECWTCEKEWADNQPYKSCIPAGEYTICRSYFHRGDYPAFEVMNVPGRSRILIHIANTPSQLAGCIAPGTRLGVLGNEWAVLSSRRAYGAFMEALEGVNQADLSIYYMSEQEAE